MLLSHYKTFAMNINNTMPTDVLDILFANRNRSYGAYQLRKNYNKRLSIALAVMISFCLLCSITYNLQAARQKEVALTDLVTEITLMHKTNEKPLVIPPTAKLKPIEQPRIATLKFTVPKLVNEQVITPPPTQDDANNIKIDVATRNGIHGDMPAPPVEQSIGTAETLIKTEDYTKEFHTVEKMAQFPGGPNAWMNFLRHNLRSETPADNGAPAGRYTVNVSFLVDREGNISEVKAMNDPGYGAAAEAIRVILRGPKWTPAEQNGRPVIYRQLQQITFVVATE